MQDFNDADTPSQTAYMIENVNIHVVVLVRQFLFYKVSVVVLVLPTHSPTPKVTGTWQKWKQVKCTCTEIAEGQPQKFSLKHGKDLSQGTWSHCEKDDRHALASWGNKPQQREIRE